MHQYQAAAASIRDQDMEAKRQRAMAMAAENRILAENKRRQQIAERVRVDLREETEITRAKYKIQSGIIR